MAQPWRGKPPVGDHARDAAPLGRPWRRRSVRHARWAPPLRAGRDRGPGPAQLGPPSAHRSGRQRHQGGPRLPANEPRRALRRDRPPHSLRSGPGGVQRAWPPAAHAAARSPRRRKAAKVWRTARRRGRGGIRVRAEGRLARSFAARDGRSLRPVSWGIHGRAGRPGETSAARHPGGHRPPGRGRRGSRSPAGRADEWARWERPVKIRIGTRGSRLALIQSELVARLLRDAGAEAVLVPIVTEGDVRPVDMSPGEGVFVAAIAGALQQSTIDAAVHSAKDVPLVEEPELVMACYPDRADPRDALITRDGRRSLATLDAGATVGTDSPRRTGFLLAARPDLRVVPLHGNVDTRLKRLDEGNVDALVIAAAGVDRLGLGQRIDQRLEPDLVAPAPGQGALAVQARRTDRRLLEVLAALDLPDIRFAVETERAVLHATGGTCRAPVGALASVSAGDFTLTVGGVNSDGSDRQVRHIEGRREEAPVMAA